MENIATCAPWLSSLSLITAKMRPPGISPALKLHFEKEKVVMKSSGHRVSHWISPLVKHALQLTLGGHQGSQPAVQHCFSMKIDLFFFFLIIFPIYKGAYCNCWSGFRTSKSSYWIVHMTHHQTPARRCSCIIHTATIAPHQRMTVSSPGLSQTPWVTMWGDPRLQHLPQVCQTCPPQTHSSAEHLGSTSCSLKCFDAKYLRGVLVCEPICLVQSNSMP